MTPAEYCQRKAAQSGSSFYYSFLFLPPERRRAITALYAFCREVDDVVDETPDRELARTRLEDWRREIAATYAGEPTHPVGKALQPIVARFNLPEAQMQAIIDGMAMDLEHDRYATFEDLLVYCHLVAGVVGLLSAEIFGITQPETRTYAHDLGIAFQLTNIIRDVGEDAERGRIYLPLDELRRHGVDPDALLRGESSAGLEALLRGYVARAREWYARAFAALPPQDRRAQRPGLIMAAVYQELLARIEASGCRVVDQRIRLSAPRKAWIAWKTARSA